MSVVLGRGLGDLTMIARTPGRSRPCDVHRTGQERNNFASILGFIITYGVPSSAAAGSKKAPLSSFFTRIWPLVRPDRDERAEVPILDAKPAAKSAVLGESDARPSPFRGGLESPTSARPSRLVSACVEVSS